MEEAIRRFNEDAFGYSRYLYHQHVYQKVRAEFPHKAIHSAWTSRDDELMNEWITNYQPRKKT